MGEDQSNLKTVTEWHQRGKGAGRGRVTENACYLKALTLQRKGGDQLGQRKGTLKKTFAIAFCKTSKRCLSRVLFTH